MGLRSAKAIAPHLCLENAYGSNLVSDISKVDYLANHLGRTQLQPLDGLPLFVDDIFVFGYLSKDDVVSCKGRVLCKTGDQGASCRVVGQVANLARHAFGKILHVQIANTISIAGPSRTIRSTVAQIERQAGNAYHTAWKKIYQQEPFGIVLQKIAVSDVDIDLLQEKLPEFARSLAANGFGMYCIDYTQDFSGVLDRPALLEYLVQEKGFRVAGDFVGALEGDVPTIYDNTNSVGNHVLQWVSKNKNGRTTRHKIYNKVVSNFEAGEVRQQVGGHLAHYADCPNEHLRATFSHHDSLARGCTRIEVSLYGGAGISKEVGNALVSSTLELVSPIDNPLFVVQPPAKQWGQLGAALDRCLVVVDRPQGEIFVAWYAHTTTGKIAGVRVVPTKEKASDPDSWERAVQWAASSFGFRGCPIFRIDILSVDNAEIDIGTLQCYRKTPTSKTFLATATHPTGLHPKGADLETWLPPVEHVEWEWRTKKTHAIGKELPEHELFPCEEIARGRSISTLSIRQRAARLQDIQDAQMLQDGGEAGRDLLQQLRAERESSNEVRREELALLEKKNRQYKRFRETIEKAAGVFQREMANQEVRKVSTLPILVPLHVVGYRTSSHGSAKVVLQRKTESYVVWATKQLDALVHGCAFEKYEDFHVLPYGDHLQAFHLSFRVEEPKSFVGESGRTIVWNPIRVLSSPEENVAKLQTLCEAHDRFEEIENDLARNTIRPSPTTPRYIDLDKAVDLPEGQYIARQYSIVSFRKKDFVALHVLALDAKNEIQTGKTHILAGPFLQIEIERLGGIDGLLVLESPLSLYLGPVRTTASKKKDRLAALSGIARTPN